MRRMKTETITGRDEAGGQIIVQNYCCLLTAWKHKHINKFPNMHTNTQTEAHTWPTVVLLHPDITVALSHAGLGVQEREAHGPLRTQTGIVAPTVFNGFLIKLLTEAERRGEGRRRSKEKENQPSISRETSGQVHEDMFHSLSLSSHADLVLVTGPSRWSALAVHAQHHLTFTGETLINIQCKVLVFLPGSAPTCSWWLHLQIACREKRRKNQQMWWVTPSPHPCSPLFINRLAFLCFTFFPELNFFLILKPLLAAALHSFPLFTSLPHVLWRPSQCLPAECRYQGHSVIQTVDF